MFKPGPKMWPLVNTSQRYKPVFFPPVKAHAEYRCVYIVRVMATRAPVAQSKPHVDHAAVTWVCFSHESRTEAAIKVVYCNGQGNTLLIAAPAQNNTEPPLTSIRPIPPAVCGSAGLRSWKDACFLASVGFVSCHQYGRAKKFCSVWHWMQAVLKTYCNVMAIVGATPSCGRDLAALT